MITAFRWLLRIASALLAVAGLTLALAWYFASRSLPDYTAAIAVEGLSGPVEIVRDTANVPHILAASDEDAFFGLGFVHAQDRLWQMTMLRRSAQGRLSEIFGERTLPADELMRRLDIYGRAQSSLAALEPATRAALEAYSRGVNAWITEVNKGALGRGAPEFFLFRGEVAYWQPADSVAILKLLAVRGSTEAASEVLRARLSLLSSDWAADLMPDAPGSGIAALPPYAALAPGLDPAAPPPRFAAGWLYPLAPPGAGAASNAWAAGPSRSASGGTLLANDPHMPFSAPAIWYLARLELRTGGVIGATVPGIPAILAGRNAAFGWGITASGIDDLDLYVEELNPADPERYRGPEGWTPFTVRRTIVEVRDAPPVTLTLRDTANGPVLPGSHFGLASVTPPGSVMSAAWTALDPADTSMDAVLGLMRARSVADGILAGERMVAPAWNVTMADGFEVALVLAGRVPRRDPQSQTQGRMPSPGWIVTNRWQGSFPYAENPRFENPPGGIVGNTNNKLTDAPFPRHLSFTAPDTQRVQRWVRLMQEREVHTRESFIAAQLDTTSTGARTILPLIGRDLWFTGEAAPEGTPERRRQEALRLLAEWDGNMNEHLPEPLLYAAWAAALQERLIRDELGPLADAFTHVEPLFLERVFRDIDGASRWCDIMQSGPVETCTDIARMALDDALVALTARYGPTVESWRWGDAHEAAHDHETLGRTTFLKWIFNIRQSTSGGDDTLNRGLTAGTGAGDNPFLSVHGAGYRGVYDFGDPDSSVFVISTGQSGHPLSRHYDDLSELWRKGEYIPMSLDPALARAAATGITMLTPAAATAEGAATP